MKPKNYQQNIPGVFVILFLAIILIINACSGANDGSIVEEDVTFTNPEDGAVLAGTFSKPSKDGIFPAVILISGSGLQDRDETVYGHKPFKALAQHLTKHGIAVLTFDDRGAGKSTGDVWDATIDVFAGDALAGINYLKTREDVNPYRIGIIGHSQGAMEGVVLASKNPEIAFLVMLAGPGVPWAENMVLANAENLRRQGKSEKNIDAGTRLLREMIPVMQAGGNYKSIESELNEVINQWKRSLTGEVKNEIEDFTKSHPGFWENMAGEFATPIYLSAVNFEPSQYLRNIRCPVLSIIGDKDIQVLSSLNNPAIQFALDQGGNENATVLEMNGINHLLQRCETGLAGEYAEIEEPFNEEVLEIIARWILEQSDVKPTDEALDKYRQQTPFTDPGDYKYLYDDLPESMEEICDLIKKQLIHPMEAGKMRDMLPEGRGPEDGDFPTVAYMLGGLIQRGSDEITLNRKPEDRLIVACYHHSLLLASILRYQGKSVRLRGGFARYFEDEMKVRFGHVICEVWDDDEKKWKLIDPDRNYINMSAHRFESPSEAWRNFRNPKSQSVKYISSVGEGAQAILHALLLDQAFVLANERSYWHTPEFLFTNDFVLDDLNRDQIKIINEIALLMDQPEFNLEKLQKLYDENSFIQTHERSIDTYYEKISEK